MTAVSVIIPAFNAQAFIGGAVRSVQCQTLSDWEIIVVNDGSTDLTGQLLDSLAAADARIRVIMHADGANYGVCRSRYLATQHAKGNYVAFLDADDEFLPTKLEQQLTHLQAYPNAVLVHGPTLLVTEDADSMWPDLSDPEVSKYMAWEAHTQKSQTTDFLRAELGRLQAGTGITWTIWSGDAFCGIISLIDWT